MSTRPGFSYSQARLAAQHALLLPEEEWRSIESIKEFNVFLDMVRNSNLGRWLSHSAYRHEHEIELRLRKQFRNYIAHISSWQPAPWQKAIQWCQILLYLPWLKLLWKNKPNDLTWAERDELLSCVGNDQEGAASYNGLIMLRQGIENDESALNTWLAVWYDLWPSHDSQDALQLKKLETFWKDFLGHLHEQDLNDIGLLDEKMLSSLHTWFRNQSQKPVSAYILLSLSAIELFRLRRELLKRCFYN